ncbi:MAG TPA: response regulator transcription factor [Egibacteraceae bacterium]|nr:response regulator transcription factor [Actinomycetota bacterium]HWB70809.1 response regulator transcription factor [Egibacteraceae bacterium]
MAERIRVLVCDDHPVVRQGLRTFLDARDDLEVVADADDGEEAVRKARHLAPDVVLMDLLLPGELDGIAATARILADRPDTRVLVLTSYPGDDNVLAAVRAGAVGYLLKDVAPADLEAAIRAAHRGEAVLAPRVTGVVLAAATRDQRLHRGLDELTARERQVLALLGEGLTNRLIARRLGVAEKTVKTHVSHLLAKLRLADRTQAALLAAREGLVADPADAGS